MPSTHSKKVANTTGYTLASVEKLLKAHSSHPVKGKWRNNRKISDLEVYVCEVIWSGNDHCRNLSDEMIPPLTKLLLYPEECKI